MANEDVAVKETKVKAEAPVQRSYFDFSSKVNRFYLDDGVSYIEHKPMDEGVYEKFQDLTSRIKLDRDGESTEVDMALGRTRQFLRETLATAWNLVDDKSNPIQFSHTRLGELPPEIIAGLVNDIYEKNPILSPVVEAGK